jgi:hypothetical protein
MQRRASAPELWGGQTHVRLSIGLDSARPFSRPVGDQIETQGRRAYGAPAGSVPPPPSDCLHLAQNMCLPGATAVAMSDLTLSRAASLKLL